MPHGGPIDMKSAVRANMLVANGFVELEDVRESESNDHYPAISSVESSDLISASCENGAIFHSPEETHMGRTVVSS